MRTEYQIDRYQETYFVIDSFEQLMRETAPGLHADLRAHPRRINRGQSPTPKAAPPGIGL